MNIDQLHTLVLSAPVLDAAAAAVAASAEVWTGFARNDAKVCLRAALDASRTEAAAPPPATIRPSHEQYVAGCDEGQLENLIDQANARLQKLRKSGWIRLWTVSLGYANVGWFEEADHAPAVKFAVEAAAESAQRKPMKCLELEVRLENYRPEEVPELLARTQKLAVPAMAPKIDG